jgi:ABC-type antimicrobial peptide transport system permease subunit
MVAQIATGFGFLALLLAATGLFSALSYEVRQQTNEIGVRIALGARPLQIAAMVFKETGLMLLAGAAAEIAARLLAAQLYGIAAFSPPLSLASYEHVRAQFSYME